MYQADPAILKVYLKTLIVPIDYEQVFPEVTPRKHGIGFTNRELRQAYYQLREVVKQNRLGTDQNLTWQFDECYTYETRTEHLYWFLVNNWPGVVDRMATD